MYSRPSGLGVLTLKNSPPPGKYEDVRAALEGGNQVHHEGAATSHSQRRFRGYDARHARAALAIVRGITISSQMWMAFRF